MSQAAAYLDYQASTPLDSRVRAVLLDALAAPGNASAEEHAFGWAAGRRLADARDMVARAISASAEEVIFTSGATEANNIAIMGAAFGAPSTRRRLLVSAIEHKSVTEAAQAMRPRGFPVETIPVGSDGVVDPEVLGSMISQDVAVVSIMAVNNEIGTVQPIQQLARVIRSAGAFFHVDATQALCALPVDAVAWNVDALSISGHKIYAPGGIGALYLAMDAPWRPAPLLHGGGQEQGLRPGTVPTPLCAAMGEACRLILQEGMVERMVVSALRDELRDAIRSVTDIQVTCEGSPRHPGSLHVRFPGVSAADLLTRLQPKVGASTGSACNSGVIGPSHVPLAIGMSVEAAAECVRFSLGRFSSRKDIEIAVQALRAAILRQAA